MKKDRPVWVCDSCEKEEVHEVGNGPNSLMAKGWVAVRHRDPNDEAAITTSHYCPDCRHGRVILGHDE